MAWEYPQPLKISRIADADLSTKQFYFVKLVSGGDGDHVDVCGNVTDVPIGVLQNNPKEGVEAEICVVGVTKISGDASLTNGQEIGTSADGQAAHYAPGTDTTKYIVGTVLFAPDGAGHLGTAVVNCAAPRRGA